jgi:hypothetical protein
VHYLFLNVVYCDSNDLIKAESYAVKTLELTKKNKERHIEGWANIKMGRILGKKDPFQVDKAEESILEGIKI